MSGFGSLSNVQVAVSLEKKNKIKTKSKFK